MDVLLTPTTASPAPVRGDIYEDHFAFTVPASLTGSPAVALPFGSSPAGLPLSVQVIGRPWRTRSSSRSHDCSNAPPGDLIAASTGIRRTNPIEVDPGNEYRLPMLLAESFVLLSLDLDGRPSNGHANQSAVSVGVVGALVTELCQLGHLDLVDDRIRPTGTVPEHPFLRQVLDNVEPHAGRRLKSRLGRIKHAGRSEVVDLMVSQGRLGRQERFLRPTRHPVLCPEEHALVLRRLHAAASSNEPMDDRTAVLLALTSACGMLGVIASDRAARKFAARRAAEAAESVPAAAAVRHVIVAAQSAVAAAATAGVVATG